MSVRALLTGLSQDVSKTFSQALCKHFSCAPEDYLRVARKHCLYPHARVLSRLLPLQVRVYEDQLLEAAGATMTEEHLAELVRDYWYHVHLYGGIAAKCLKLRISGERLKRLFAEVMGEGSGPVGDCE